MPENNDSLTELIYKEVSRFTEWRGTVKQALKHIVDDLARRDKAEEILRSEIGLAFTRREKAEEEIKADIKDIQNQQRECRERCDKVACKKAEKEDLKDTKDTVKAIKEDQTAQEKLQIKQQVTLAFYGIIGGGIFTLAVALFNYVLKTLKG